MSAVEHYPRGVAVEQPQINWDSPQIKAEIRRQNGNKQGYPDWGTYLRHSMSEGASVEKGVSAAIFFPPLADLEYLQNQGALEKADVLLFARQQELQAAAEHAAQVPTTELTGLASQGRFTIFQGPDDKKGHDILDMAQNALRIDPGNRRIAADYLGYTQIHNALLNGQSAVMFSPTKLRAQNKKDEYGLAFVFVYEGKDHEGNIKFREQICMYKEPYGDPQTSRDLMDSLSQKLGIQRKDTSAWEFADFVAQPLITDKHAALDIKEMQGLFGTTQAERDFGDEFRVLLSRVMEDELRAYGEMLHTHLRLTPNSPKNEIDSFVEKASSLKNMIFSTAVELGRLMRAGDRSELQSFIDKLKPNKAAKLPTADSIFRSPEAVARDAQYMLHTGIVTQANITATGCPSAYMSSGVSILQPRPGESVGAFQLRIAKENMAIKKEKTILWSKKLGRQFVVEYKFVKPEDARVSCKGCDGTGLELGPCRICKECTIDWLEKNELHTRRN